MSFFSNLFNHVFTYPIFNALMTLYHVVGDFGLAIILLTCIISVLLLPLTLRQLRQAKATRALQPSLAEIRKQHLNDRVAQTQATQALYKEYGIHPGFTISLATCTTTDLLWVVLCTKHSVTCTNSNCHQHAHVSIFVSFQQPPKYQLDVVYHHQCSVAFLIELS